MRTLVLPHAIQPFHKCISQLESLLVRIEWQWMIFPFFFFILFRSILYHFFTFDVFSSLLLSHRRMRCRQSVFTLVQNVPFSVFCSSTLWPKRNEKKDAGKKTSHSSKVIQCVASQKRKEWDKWRDEEYKMKRKNRHENLLFITKRNRKYFRCERAIVEYKNWWQSARLVRWANEKYFFFFQSHEKKRAEKMREAKRTTNRALHTSRRQ